MIYLIRDSENHIYGNFTDKDTAKKEATRFLSESLREIFVDGMPTEGVGRTFRVFCIEQKDGHFWETFLPRNGSPKRRMIS